MTPPFHQAPTAVSERAFGLSAVHSSRSELFVDPRWYEVLGHSFGVQVDVQTSGASVLPTADIDDARGRRIRSLPFCDFVDAPMNATDWPTLIDPILAVGIPIMMETLADHPVTTDSRFQSITDGVHHIIDLKDTFDEMMPDFATLTRRQIRRAHRTGIQFDVSTSTADLAAFHALHVGVRRDRHQLLAQPFAMFETIRDCFGDDLALVIGRRNGNVVGGCLLLRTASAWHYKFSASAESARHDGVSHAAVAAALQFCIDTNTPRFDFGRSDIAHEGLVAFKRRFAPNEVTLACSAANQGPESPFSRDLHHLTQLFTSPGVPQSVTAEAGATLYRYFA